MSQLASQRRHQHLPVARWRFAWSELTLPAIVTAVTLLAIHTGIEPGARDPDLVGYAFGLVIGGAFLLRRVSPVAVLLIVLVAGAIYHSLNYPGGAPMFALGAALYIVAVAGRRNVGLVLGGLSSAGALAYRAIAEGHSLFEMSMIAEPALVVAAVMLGDAVHSRRQWMAEVQERLDRAETEREEEARRRVDQERLRIAHELHDVLAHTLAVVNVQAGVAADLIEDDPVATRAALGEMRKASRDAMSELRATVGVLRDASPAPRAPTPRLSDLPRVVDVARQAGVDVETVVEGEPRDLPVPVELTAFRVLQEALTNVVKHAEARSARVTVRYEPDGLALRVVDDGRGTSGQAVPGFGMVGMRERVEALGGRFDASGRDGGGFVVRAWVPTGVGA